MRANRYIEESIRGFLAVLERALESEELARRRGLLQSLDPRVKVLGLLVLIVAAAASRRIEVILAIFGVALALALLSRVPMRTLAARVWIGVLVFASLIVLPALFLTPGRAIWALPVLGWTITAQGLQGAAYLISRVETTATLSMLLVLSTPWTHVLKALRVLRVPVVVNCDPRHDLPLHLPLDGGGAGDVRIAAQPAWWENSRARTAAGWP